MVVRAKAQQGQRDELESLRAALTPPDVPLRTTGGRDLVHPRGRGWWPEISSWSAKGRWTARRSWPATSSDMAWTPLATPRWSHRTAHSRPSAGHAAGAVRCGSHPRDHSDPTGRSTRTGRSRARRRSHRVRRRPAGRRLVHRRMPRGAGSSSSPGRHQGRGPAPGGRQPSDRSAEAPYRAK